MAALVARIARVARLASLAAGAVLVTGCGSMIAGSGAWFENQKPDVEPLAKADLACNDKPIQFAAVSGDDYREVEARGCGKKVTYKLVKIAFVEKWQKAGDVTAL
jgi:hypothetical protein